MVAEETGQQIQTGVSGRICPSYGKIVRIELYYKKKDNSHEVSLSGRYLSDSDEELNTFEVAFVWFYN